MRATMFSVAPMLLFLWFVSTPSVAQSDTYFEYTFDEDLGDLTVHRGIWKWSDRAGMAYKVPPGPDGFAVYDTPGEGDELYSEFIPLDFGLNYSIVFFFSSRYEQSTTFALHKLSYGGEYLETVADYTHLSDPQNEDWITVTGYVPPEKNALNIPTPMDSMVIFGVVPSIPWACSQDLHCQQARPPPRQPRPPPRQPRPPPRQPRPPPRQPRPLPPLPQLQLPLQLLKHLREFR
ncbi:hypothetical protein FHG87_010271 [Trinorchestia longiramus]|nr:hypothetical protein FHG87_010271 [Trinorchestia longiramus]